MRGLFVTGTDTGAGKSVLAAALTAAIAAAGEPVRAHKPVLTGLDEDPGDWPRDHELLAAACGMDPDEVSPERYGPAVSPHLAAELAGRPLDPAGVLAAARRAGRREGEIEPAVIVEGVGGLLVPLAHRYTVRDLAVELGLPVVIAARPALGTINHTLLTLEAARAAGLDVRAVVLTPWPAQPSEMERSNRATIAELGAVEVATLPTIGPPGAAGLAEAGGALPWPRWLGDRA